MKRKKGTGDREQGMVNSGACRRGPLGFCNPKSAIRNASARSSQYDGRSDPRTGFKHYTVCLILCPPACSARRRPGVEKRSASHRSIEQPCQY